MTNDTKSDLHALEAGLLVTLECFHTACIPGDKMVPGVRKTLFQTMPELGKAHKKAFEGLRTLLAITEELVQKEATT